MSWVAAAVGVGTLAYGAYQQHQGKKEARKGERKLALEASKENKAAAERQKRLESAAAISGEMPGETRRKNVIGANTAQRITASKEASTSAANQQAAIAQAVLDQQDEYGKLAAEAEQYQEDKQTAAIEGLGDMARLEEGYRERKMDIAEGQISKGEAMKGAGQQNIAGGATSVAGTMGSSGMSKRERSGNNLTKGQVEGRAAEKQYERYQRKQRKQRRRGSRRDARFEKRVDKDISKGYFNK